MVLPDPAKPVAAVKALLSLELEADGSPPASRQFIRLPPPIAPLSVQFTIRSGSQALNKAVLRTNYPIDGFEYDGHHNATGVVSFGIPGAFEYYVEYASTVDGQGEIKCRSALTGYVVVEPRLRVTRLGPSDPAAGQGCAYNIPLDGIVLQTVVPKWMGHIDGWFDQLKISAEAGYNMVHFVPIQQRGASNSPYSLFDQLELSEDFFDEGTAPDERVLVLRDLLDKMEDDLGMLSITDVVYNHTASNSDWLKDHPEAGYNLQNSPHLKAAYDLDEGLMQFSREMPTVYKLPTIIEDEGELSQILSVFEHVHLRKLRLWEYFVINVSKSVQDVMEAMSRSYQVASNPYNGNHLRSLSLKERADIIKRDGLVDDRSGERGSRHVRTDVALAFLDAYFFGPPHSNDDIQARCSEYARILDAINVPFYDQYDVDIQVIIANITSRIRYERLAPHGPRLGEVSSERPLVDSYFTRIPHKDGRDPNLEKLANNGWIWNGDPLVDFASPGQQVYFRREVIVWGDCVKLRYGRSRDDSPWLWDHMAEYTRMMATLFQGFRIDNCHSTPIHVAQYLLDIARSVRPDLYVVAELFTGSEEKDIYFVSKLGINSLIREAMQAWDAAELSRLVYRHGGQPVGSISMRVQYLTEDIMTHFDDKRSSFELRGGLPHALFMDCTHDNETPTQKRNTIDLLANSAAVCFSVCAVGSVRGYDEAVPELLNLVHEDRLYEPAGYDRGIIPAKAVLQKLHTKMALEGFSEIHVHQEGQYVRVYRQNPMNHRGYLLIAHTAFRNNPNMYAAPIKLRGTVAKVILSARLTANDADFEDDVDYIQGIPIHMEWARDAISNIVSISSGIDEHGSFEEISLLHFPMGSIVVLETELAPTEGQALMLFKNVSGLEGISGGWFFDGVQRGRITELENSLAECDANDLNILLYRAEVEEQDTIPGRGVYDIPGHGKLAYCGLVGLTQVLKELAYRNDLGHAVCDNLRAGFWLMDYTVERLSSHVHLFPALKRCREYLARRIELIKRLPNYLIPKYFVILILSTAHAAEQRAFELMSETVAEGTEFMRRLALGSVQLYGTVLSTGLHPMRPTPSLAAGLTHFATRHMRCWGRDIFISVRGLFLVTGRYSAAKEHIVAFACNVRHGLIPNLLDAGRRPRFNARDAAWWFLQAVKDYAELAPNGLSILRERVERRFPDDRFIDYSAAAMAAMSLDQTRNLASHCTVADIVQEILQRHADGITFREYNAGRDLDQVMRDEGFNVHAYLDHSTGFIGGGNRFNCGTWMDKMGESVRAGTVGLPATPRDGCAVEIVGLCKSVVTWLAQLHASGQYERAGVTLSADEGDASTKVVFTWSEWSQKIMDNFEKKYYVPLSPGEDGNHHIRADHVNRRGIYKDLFNSSMGYTDYQLRPNFLVAMTVAPELFTPEKAAGALATAQSELRGPLGMKTLDPSDWTYRGIYDNSNDSDDASIARGFNYHQGPEWVWCFGYFLRAKLIFDLKTKRKSILEIGHEQQALVSQHKATIQSAPFAGLPELTNANGAVCYHSCEVQAWSMATLLDAEYDLLCARKAHEKERS